jgi:dihydroorotase-like cyclic amidohydrolase
MAVTFLRPEERRELRELREAMVEAFTSNSLDMLVSDHLGTPLAASHTRQNSRT